MKKKLLIAVILVFTVSINHIYSQGVSINEDGADPHATAILDLKSSEQGFLIPRMTTLEIQAITNPADGLQVYNSEDGKLYLFVGSEVQWKEVSYGTGTLSPDFICGEQPLYDYRDGKSYNTVEINGQCWMAENLNYGEFITTGQYNDGVVNKNCYNGDESNCNEYGAFYNWNEAMNWATVPGYQGICPSGWHIPTDSEIYQMENFLDPYVSNPGQTGFRGSNIGSQLKEAGFTHWFGNNTQSTNSSGFTLLGTGYRSSNGSYYNLNNSTQFWSSTFSSGKAYYREFYSSNPLSARYSTLPSYFFSVRCLKDQ